VQAVAFVAEHCPHAPDGSHAGVAPPHSPSPAQGRQAWVAVPQIGLLPPHWALPRHATQVPGPTSQAGVAPVQAVAFVAEHCPHAPDGSHAGVAPPQSPSPAHPRQT
jgi:hypothetical protein